MNCDEYCSNHGCNRGPNCPAGEKITLIKSNPAKIDDEVEIEIPDWFIKFIVFFIYSFAVFSAGWIAANIFNFAK